MFTKRNSSLPAVRWHQKRIKGQTTESASIRQLHPTSSLARGQLTKQSSTLLPTLWRNINIAPSSTYQHITMIALGICSYVANRRWVIHDPLLSSSSTRTVFFYLPFSCRSFSCFSRFSCRSDNCVTFLCVPTLFSFALSGFHSTWSFPSLKKDLPIVEIDDGYLVKKKFNVYHYIKHFVIKVYSIYI